MSLMSMKRTFTKHSAWIMGGLAFVMVGGVAFTGLGANLSDVAPGGGAAGGAAVETPVATVGGVAVSRTALDRQLDQQLQQQRIYMPPGMPEPSGAQLATMRLGILDQAKEQRAVVEAAKKAGITVSAADIAREREKVWAQQKGQFVQALGLKPAATDAEINGALAKQNAGVTVDLLKQQGISDEQLRDSLYAQGLQAKFKSEVQAKTTEAQVRQSYSDVRVRHILVASGPNGLPEAQARAKAEKLLAAALKDPASLTRLAKENTDDPGSKNTGGLYDWGPASRYVPAFSEAALSVKTGQINPQLAQTPYGFHIVKNEGVRPGKDFPKDFDKNKQKYIDEYADRIAQSRVQEAVTAAGPDVKVTINDPVLRAARLQTEAQQAPDKKARDAKLNQALSELASVKPADDPAGVAPLMKASLFEALGKPAEAAAAYKEALATRNGLDTRLALARLLLGQKDKAGAADQLQQAESLVRGEVMSQQQIAQMYGEAGRADLASAAQTKYAAMAQRQAEMNRAQQQQQQQQMPGNTALPAAAPAAAQPPPGG